MTADVPGWEPGPNPSWSPQYNPEMALGTVGQNWEGKPQAKSTATSGTVRPGLHAQAIHLTGQTRPWHTPPGFYLTHMYT